jgi:hypothetical protein
MEAVRRSSSCRNRFAASCGGHGCQGLMRRGAARGSRLKGGTSISSVFRMSWALQPTTCNASLAAASRSAVLWLAYSSAVQAGNR